MYILGNAPQLARKSQMWSAIIDELQEKGCIGDGWPLFCSRHPHHESDAVQPGDLTSIAPQGMLLFGFITSGANVQGGCQADW